jgi:putative ABC transport system permease protein
MTLSRFVTKSAFRNRRRSILTVLSISFSFLLLTFLMTIWRGFYLDEGSPSSAQRLVTRHRVSLTFSMPSFYREKIRAIPGVVSVVPGNWFGGLYKDNKPENFFAQFGTDPEELFKAFPENHLPGDQLAAWQRDRTGAVVGSDLAKKYNWKIGDRVVIMGTIWGVNLDLTIRGIFTSSEPSQVMFFNSKYVEESVPPAKDKSGVFWILVDSPNQVSRVATTVDDMFHNSPQPTKTESEKAFQLGFIAMLGNVKLFLSSICLAVVFTTLLVSANTMAMSIRERTREVAVLKTLGFRRQTVLALFISEAVVVALLGGLLGVLAASGLIFMFSHSPQAAGFFAAIKMTPPTMAVALLIAGHGGLPERAGSFVSRFQGRHCGGFALHRLADKIYGNPDQLQPAQPEAPQGPDHHDRAGHRAHRDHGSVPDGPGGRTGPRVCHQRRSPERPGAAQGFNSGAFWRFRRSAVPHPA